MSKAKLEKDLFEDKIFELTDEKKYGKGHLENIIRNILVKEGKEFGMLLRFTQGTVMKKGFKLLTKSKMLCPVYFLMKEDIPDSGKV